MKKVKILFLTILAVLICFSCAGCARDGRYVQDSLEYDCNLYSSLNKITAIYSFKVELPNTEKYELSYGVFLYYGNREISSEQVTTTVKLNGKEAVEISEYWDITYSGSNIVESGLQVVVRDVRITPYKVDDSYSGYAIGYGVAGGLLLVVSTVIFIMSKSKKNDLTV